MLLCLKRDASCVFCTHIHWVPVPDRTALSWAIFCCVTKVTNVVLSFATFLAYCKITDLQFKHCRLCNWNSGLHIALFLEGGFYWLLRFLCLVVPVTYLPFLRTPSITCQPWLPSVGCRMHFVAVFNTLAVMELVVVGLPSCSPPISSMT